MTKTPEADGLSYVDIGKAGVSLFEVRLRDDVIGRVQRYQMGAGQFGSSWMALSVEGQKASNFRSRAAAAAWLVEQAGS